MRRALATFCLLALLVPPAAAQAPGGLGDGLTPLGAIRGANAQGTIPAWTGGLTEPPRTFVAGTHHPDPFVDDGRWFTVRAAELDRFAVRLSAGQQELLRRYPDSFELPMYLTRRTAAAPQRIYDATAVNARRARLAENGLAVRDVGAGIPFPVPDNGDEVMWNHVLRWRGTAVSRIDGIVLPAADGTLAVDRYREDWLADQDAGPGGLTAFSYKRTGLSPPAVAGATLLIRETLNPLRNPRAVWYRPAGKGAAVRAPDFSYGTPDPATGGVRTADMLDMFSGLPDRFDFRLVGRREMYVPYNAYRLNIAALTPRDFLWPPHPDPAFLRYELHRVWVVEATLKRGYRHPFPRRTYYLDEDSWQILMADHYDAKGALARYAEAHPIVIPEVPVLLPTLELTYDFAGNRYVASGLDNADPPPAFDRPLKPDAFSPDALKPARRW
ncbi:DUF1329 domain-containing protein [Azospirillum sp. ST 5-10]|uniref:DUF1329 domain-containing protein n=1 Tax=unclassified Azospirillum TaxID=2630922 RepID=UPI003F4A6AAA